MSNFPQMFPKMRQIFASKFPQMLPNMRPYYTKKYRVGSFNILRTNFWKNLPKMRQITICTFPEVKCFELATFILTMTGRQVSPLCDGILPTQTSKKKRLEVLWQSTDWTYQCHTIQIGFNHGISGVLKLFPWLICSSH